MSKMADGSGKPKTREFPWCCTILARTFGVITALSKFVSFGHLSYSAICVPFLTCSIYRCFDVDSSACMCLILFLVMFLCGIVTLIPTGIFFGSFGSVGRCIGAGILLLWVLCSLCLHYLWHALVCSAAEVQACPKWNSYTWVCL